MAAHCTRRHCPKEVGVFGLSNWAAGDHMPMFGKECWTKTSRLHWSSRTTWIGIFISATSLSSSAITWLSRLSFQICCLAQNQYQPHMVRRLLGKSLLCWINVLPTVGLDWDVLYVGSCWDIPNGDNRPPHFLYHDPFAPSRNQTGGSYINELEGWGAKVTETSRHRLIAPSWYPVCTIGYAVTRKGAEKLLYNLGGYKGLGAPVDLGMISLIQKGILDSYTIIPPIVTRFRTGGPRDSDIDEVSPNDSDPGGSENLQMSAREVMENIEEK